MRLLLERPAAGGYFRPLAEHPSLAQALWTTVCELCMAGVGARQLNSRQRALLGTAGGGRRGRQALEY